MLAECPFFDLQAVLDYLRHNPMTVSSLAMQYDAEPTTPLPDCLQGLSPAAVAPSSSSATADMAKVIAGLLFAACGALDHSHNLVTPLCWGSWTPYAGQVAVAFCTAAHCSRYLVHATWAFALASSCASVPCDGSRGAQSKVEPGSGRTAFQPSTVPEKHLQLQLQNYQTAPQASLSLAPTMY
jgi:hypothetical protein